MNEKKAREQVYRLHHQGIAVPKIAKSLGLDPEIVRGYIVDAWYEDREEARLTKATSNRR